MTPEHLDELRMVQLTAHVLLPLLETRLHQSYEKLLGAFRNGSTENLAAIAECNAYQSLIDEINFKITELEHKEP